MMTNQKSSRKDSGFTIIELVLATLIFSIVMVVILFSAFEIGRIYYKGVSISDTSGDARTTITDITNDVRFANYAYPVTAWGSAPVSSPAKGYYFCIGVHRYTYVLNNKVTNDEINHISQTPTNYTQYINAGIVQDEISTGCPAPGTSSQPGTKPIQLLGPDMQLNDLTFDCSNSIQCAVHVHIVFYGSDNTVFNSSKHPADTASDHAAAVYDPDAYCSANLLSSQFCAVSDLQTNALFRP